MATWQLVNVQTGSTELPKYVEIAVVTEVWALTLPTTLANGDTIVGPTLQAGLYLDNVKVDVAALDTGNTLAFEVGYTGALAAFIASGNTTARAGGIVGANVPGTVGFTATTNTQIIATITAGPTTPVAGRFCISITFTASP